MKLIITGYAQHGKDTVCDLLSAIYDLKSISSSLFAVNHTNAFDDLARIAEMDKKMLYINRGDFRPEFFNIIRQYNIDNGMTALGDGIFAQFSIYNGIRNDEEFFALKKAKAFDHAIWVDASRRKPSEDESSCKMKSEYCDYVLDNNGNKPRLVRSILTMMDSLMALHKQPEMLSKL